MKIQSIVLFSPECIYCICFSAATRFVCLSVNCNTNDNAAAYNAKWLLLRLEKPSSLIACLRSNTKMLFFFFGLFYKRAPADAERPRTRSKCSSYVCATQRRRRPFYGTLTALLYRPVRRDWNNVSSRHACKPRE